MSLLCMSCLALSVSLACILLNSSILKLLHAMASNKRPATVTGSHFIEIFLLRSS